MILSAALLAAASVLQPGPDWRGLADNEDVQMMWDAAGVSREGDLTVVAVRIRPKPLRTGENAYAIARIEMRCARNESRVAHTQNFGSNDRPGARDDSNLSFVEIPAGSFIETLRDNVCPPRR